MACGTKFVSNFWIWFEWRAQRVHKTILNFHADSLFLNSTVLLSKIRKIPGQAELVPAKVIVNNNFIMCDQRVQPKYRCCLPTGPHLVCYNIMWVCIHAVFIMSNPLLRKDITMWQNQIRSFIIQGRRAIPQLWRCSCPAVHRYLWALCTYYSVPEERTGAVHSCE